MASVGLDLVSNAISGNYFSGSSSISANEAIPGDIYMVTVSGLLVTTSFFNITTSMFGSAIMGLDAYNPTNFGFLYIIYIYIISTTSCRGYAYMRTNTGNLYNHAINTNINTTVSSTISVIVQTTTPQTVPLNLIIERL